MEFKRDACLQLDAALDRHWLETDGRGGYAASTVLMCATSRFHGLLVASSREQPKPHNFLSRFEEMFCADGREFPISAARYPSDISPGGHRFVHHCEFAPRPSFTYRIGHVEATREIQVVRGRPAVLVRYTATGQRMPLELRLRPLVPFRARNDLTWKNDGIDDRVRGLPRGISLRLYEALPRLTIAFSQAAHFDSDPQWYRGIEYSDDLARGYEGHEDQWSPGVLRLSLADGDSVVVAASIGEPVDDPAAAWDSEESRRVTVATGRSPGVRGVLERAADDYLYETLDDRPGVIAGYPWFEEWGRDTLIALPGLTLARGQVEECGRVLCGLLPFLKDGRFPNVFGQGPADSDYKAVDPSMWFGRAVRLYADAGGDESRLLDELLPALLSIAQAHRDASQPGLRCGSTGLIDAGVPEIATTWMDAVVDGIPVTPRHGYQVEVNALWYVLVDTVALLLKRAGRKAEASEWAAFGKSLGPAFIDRFWVPAKNRLADRVVDGEQDDTVRPNMVIAAALDPSPLSKKQRQAVVALARAELLTSRGLRTLSPRYLRYRGRFGGDPRTRDEAYHQGTVWPWLLGFYVEAELRANGRSAAAKKRLRALLDDFELHLSEHGIGQVAEVFDGDPPHRPGGCFGQAWSVSELLRAYALLDAGGAQR